MQKSGLSELAREIAVLSGLSELFSEYTIEQACRRVGVDPARAGPREFQRVVPELRRTLSIFLRGEEAERRLKAIHARLQAASEDTESLRPLRLTVAKEADVALARGTIRDLCLRLSTSEFLLQRACTITSELVRNMVSYAGGGTFTAEVVSEGATRRLRLRARDTGPGIPRLDDILAGRYRSRTGLGLGIRGVKRMAQAFRIETGSEGTFVEAELVL